MMSKLKEFFDGDTCKVLGAGLTGGTFTNMSPDKQAAFFVGVMTCVYIGIKIVKQIRDWNKPDKE